MKFQIGAMSVGDILDRGLKMLFSRLPTFYVINLVVLSPIILLQLVMPFLMEAIAASGVGGGQVTATFVSIGLALLLWLILQPIGTGAILHVIAQEFVDKRVGLGAAFAFAFARFGKLFGTALLTGLIIFGVLLLCMLPGFLAMFGSPNAGAILLFVGMVVGVVLAIYFWIWYIFAAQVVVVEDLAGTSALKRSKELTGGFRGRVFGLLLLFGVIGIILQLAVTLLEWVLPPQEAVPVERGSFGDRFGRTEVLYVLNYPNYAINIVVGQLLAILVRTYEAVCFTLMYFDVRIRKEGFDLELAARQQAPTTP